MDDQHRDARAGATPDADTTPRRFDAATPDEVAELETTFGVDLDEDGAIGPASGSGSTAASASTGHGTTSLAPDERGPVVRHSGARRWWPSLIGLAAGAALAWYFLS